MDMDCCTLQSTLYVRLLYTEHTIRSVMLTFCSSVCTVNAPLHVAAHATPVSALLQSTVVNTATHLAAIHLRLDLAANVRLVVPGAHDDSSCCSSSRRWLTMRNDSRLEFRPTNRGDLSAATHPYKLKHAAVQRSAARCNNKKVVLCTWTRQHTTQQHKAHSKRLQNISTTVPCAIFMYDAITTHADTTLEAITDKNPRRWSQTGCDEVLLSTTQQEQE